MPNIPTFNAGDLMKDVRENSLNPVINKVNSLDSTVTSLQTDVTNLDKKADKSVIGVSQPNPDQLQFTHGDSSKQVITITQSAEDEIDTTGLQKHEIVGWDPVTGKFKGTGVFANLGELTVAPGTVLFGNHRMSSSIENVVFTNEDSKENYVPVWQDLKPGSNTAYIRAINKDLEDVVRVAKGDANVINPVNRNVQILKDETFFGGTFILAQSATDIIMEIFDKDSYKVWEDQLGDLDAGEHSVSFEIPFDIKKGYLYDIYLKSRDGDIVAKGPVAGTGVEFSWTARRALWEDRLVPSVEKNLLSGTIPVWNSLENRLESTGISSVDGDLITGPEGLKMGAVKVTSSESGLTITPPGSNNGEKILTQSVSGGSETAYIRKYGASKEITISTDDSEDLTGTISFAIVPNDNISVSTISVFPTVPLALMKVEAFNPDGDEVWSQTFYRVDGRSEQELLVGTSPDFKKGIRYLFVVTGQAQSANDVFQLKGKNNVPYGRLGVISWTGEELATKTWVTAQGSVVNNPASLYIKDFTDSTYSPSQDLFFDQRTLFTYKGVGDGSLVLPVLPSNSGVTDTYSLVKNLSENRGTLTLRASGTNSIGDASFPSFTLPYNFTAMILTNVEDSKWLIIVLEGEVLTKTVKDVVEKSDKSGVTIRFTNNTSKDIDFPVGNTLDPSKVVKNISPNNNGKDLTIFYYDDSNVTVKLDGWTSDIAGLQNSINKLKNKLNSRTKFFVYAGATAPVIPKGTRGGYYLTFAGLTSDIDITTPSTSSNISDGTIFFIDNDSDQYSVNIAPGKTGQTFDGSPSVQVLPNTVAWFIKDNGNWHTLFSGYLPSSFKHMVTEVKANLLADDTFLRDIQVQGDQPSADVLSCDKLEFAGCKVAADPKDSRRGIITVDSGISFVNPDGSSVTNTKFKLVGMEVKDPGDGTPPKIHLLTDHGTPAPHPTSAYAFFSTDKDAPGTVPFQTLPVFRGGRVTVHKDTTAPQYVYIMLPPGEGDDAERVGELGGLPAYWAKQSKDYTVGVGQVRTYTVFRSPYPFTEKDVTLVIYP